MPSPVQLFGLGQQSKSPNITAQHRLNLYYDLQVDNDKCTVAAFLTPGLNLFSSVSASTSRGLHWMETNNMVYAVQRGTLYEIAANGAVTNRGTLAVTPTQDIDGRVAMANNGTQLMIVTGAYAYIYNSVTHVFTDITASLPFSESVDSVCFLNSYFIINRGGTGQFYLSDPYNGLVWPALAFATAESNPDNLMAVAADKGNLCLLGTSTIELWTGISDPTVPFTKINAAPSDGGLAARWSLSRGNGLLTGLFRNKQGALAVCMLDGYTLVAISGPNMDYIFNNYTTPTDAVAFGYTLNGRKFYQITFQAAQKTWLYDYESTAWTQLKSWGIDRHIGDLGVSFDTKFIVSDYASGQLYVLSVDARTDNGLPIERELTSNHVYSVSRNIMTIRRLRVDMEGGVGLISGQGDSPSIMLQISRDGGHTWGNEMWTKIGKIGEFTHRAEWRRLGRSRDWVFKLRITDPVKIVIIQAVIEGEELQS